VPSADALRVDIDAEVPEHADGDLAFRAFDAATGKDSDATAGKENPSDLLGRQNGQAASAEAPLRGEHASGREAATPFHASLEQVRASEARLAAAKPEHLHHARTAHEAEVMAQLARKLTALGNRGAEEIRIQLEPEHLGRVRIALERGEGGMNARIAVENDAVRQIVDSNLAGLKQSLEDQGIKLQNLDVSVEHRHASLFNPDGSNAREFFRRPGNGGGASQGVESAEEAGEAETGRRLGYNTMEYIA
jgi:flagellar hook-length control protein FliK